MKNITKCRGQDCIIKEFCYRYYCESTENSSYLPKSPWDGKRCEMFHVDENGVDDLLLKLKKNK